MGGDEMGGEEMGGDGRACTCMHAIRVPTLSFAVSSCTRTSSASTKHSEVTAEASLDPSTSRRASYQPLLPATRQHAAKGQAGKGQGKGRERSRDRERVRTQHEVGVVPLLDEHIAHDGGSRGHRQAVGGGGSTEGGEGGGHGGVERRHELDATCAGDMREGEGGGGDHAARAGAQVDDDAVVRHSDGAEQLVPVWRGRGRSGQSRAARTCMEG
jgi:hypothetical protein